MPGLKQKITTIIALAVSASIGLGVGYSIKEDVLLNQQKVAIVEPSASNTSTPNFPIPPRIPKYVLRGFEGRLAVFIGDKSQPEIIFDQYIHLLPDVDRKDLERGIEVDDYEQLLKLIEDYTS